MVIFFGREKFFMSERQAKLNRKTKSEKAEIKKSPKKTLETAVCVVVIAAVAGLGVYASWDKVKAGIASNTSSQQTQTADNTSSQQTQTVADIASGKETTADELLKKCGLESSGLTGESDASEFYAKLTIDGFAKFDDKTSDELKKEYGIESLSDDTLWQDAQMKVPMSKIAEQNGQSFEDFAKQNNLPSEITEATTYEDAIKALQNQQQNAE